MFSFTQLALDIYSYDYYYYFIHYDKLTDCMFVSGTERLVSWVGGVFFFFNTNMNMNMNMNINMDQTLTITKQPIHL